jgi:hypothetical protein
LKTSIQRSILPAIALACTVWLAGCAINLPDLDSPKETWSRIRLPTALYVLTAYGPPPPFRAEALTLYIEDDSPQETGLLPYPDPTPSPPLSQRLAVLDPSRDVIHLARPCQFVRSRADSAACTAAAWGPQRFATDSVEAMHQAIDLLKQQTGALRFRLVGVGGGGIMAALLAARRVDVTELVTVGAPLDASRWGARQRSISVDPATAPKVDMGRLRFVQQVHFVGDKDPIATPRMLDGFVASQPPGKPVEIFVVQGADHTCCWAKHWPDMLKSAELVFARPSDPIQ